MVAMLTGALVLLALALGGSTSTGFLGDLFVQGAGFVLLIVLLFNASTGSHAVVARRHQREGDGSNLPLGRAASHAPPIIGPITIVVGLIVVIAVLQTAPLGLGIQPQSIKSLDFSAAGIADGARWATISLSPHASMAALLSLVVPVAIFFGVRASSQSGRVALAFLILGFGAISMLIGLVQVAQGPGSPLRFYTVTNPDDAVGFFANRNHLAALLVVTLLIGTVWLVSVGQSQQTAWGGAANAQAFFLVAAVCLVVALVAAIVFTRSRAGLVMAGIALLFILAAAFLGGRGRGSSKGPMNGWVGRLIVAVVCLSLLFALVFGWARMEARFESAGVSGDLRLPIFATSLAVMLDSLPWGTGLGSFVPVYAVTENAADLTSNYVNRAHNDILELMLETGLVGVSLAGILFLWFLARAVPVFVRGKDSDQTYTLLQRVSVLVVLLLIGHSLVDYPLRTTALAAVFAFSLAMLTPTHETGHRGDATRRSSAVSTPSERSGARVRNVAGDASRKSPHDITSHPGTLEQRPKSGPLAPEVVREWPDAWRHGGSKRDDNAS